MVHQSRMSPPQHTTSSIVLRQNSQVLATTSEDTQSRSSNECGSLGESSLPTPRRCSPGVLECLSQAPRQESEYLQLAVGCREERENSISQRDCSHSQSQEFVPQILQFDDYQIADTHLSRRVSGLTAEDLDLHPKAREARSRRDSTASSTGSGDTELDGSVVPLNDMEVLSWAPTVVEAFQPIASIDQRSGASLGIPPEAHMDGRSRILKPTSSGHSRRISAADTIDMLLGLGRTEASLVLEELLSFDDPDLGEIVRGFVQSASAHDDASGAAVEEALQLDWWMKKVGIDREGTPMAGGGR